MLRFLHDLLQHVVDLFDLDADDLGNDDRDREENRRADDDIPGEGKTAEAGGSARDAAGQQCDDQCIHKNHSFLVFGFHKPAVI